MLFGKKEDIQNITFVGVTAVIIWFLIGYNMCECSPFRASWPKDATNWYRLYWYQDFLLVISVWSIVGYNLGKD